MGKISYRISLLSHANSSLDSSCALLGLRTSFILATLCIVVIATFNASGATTMQVGFYYIATDGNDSTGEGSPENPWATINYALSAVPDGSTILVRPGTYTGRTSLRGTFSQGVTIRSEIPYQARLRNNGTVVICFYGRGITLEGFDIAHSGPGSGALPLHLGHKSI